MSGVAVAEACRLCEGPLAPMGAVPASLRPVTGGDVLRCTSCASLQVLPVPSPQELARLYEEDYWAEFRARWGIRGGDTEVAPQLKLRLREIESRLATGRLLDLGCAMGHFVAHARDQGWEAIGVEPSVAAAEEGRRRYGVTIHNCVLEAAPIPPASQDVVHSNHVIEHLPDPVGTLRTAFRMLRPGGILVAEVPQELATPLV
ncbi:MAG TPA: class I SAM-dependent methyltransferase, partial [Candidatus Acidoferrales bacterium]|nr:class I SAM-dependent methyltransferase [Candidatus Acidoferrales bacterium]